MSQDNIDNLKWMTKQSGIDLYDMAQDFDSKIRNFEEQADGHINE